MFNESEIVRVLSMKYKNPDLRGSDSFFSVCPIIEYRANPGRWLVLQTVKDYIVLGYDGVKVLDYLPSFDDGYDACPLDFEDVDEDESFLSSETVLFKGEHLIDVITEEERYILKFDHFDMFLYPTELGKLFYRPNSSYYPISGYERYYKRLCDCGGSPELMFDRVADFFIRCSKCHKATWATFVIEEVIDDWNNGLIEIVYDTPQERFMNYVNKPIIYIDLHEWYTKYDENLYECESLMLVYEDTIFNIESQRVGKDQFGFHIGEFCDYNKSMWPIRIEPPMDEKLFFIREEWEEECSHVLRLQMGTRPILITATEYEVMIGFSHCGLDDEWVEYDDNVLIKDREIVHE